MSKSSSLAKFLTNAILFLGIFCLLVKFGIYVVFVAALVMAVRIIKSLN